MSFNPVFPTLFGSGVSGATKIGSVLGSQVGLFTGTMLGGFSGGGAVPAFNTPPDDYFAYNGSTAPWYGAPTGEQAIYDSATNKTFVCYEGWNGSKRTVSVMSYDHTSKAWSAEYVASTDTLWNDDHGVPAMCIDGSGYIHIFFGCHNTPQKWIKSNNPKDITAWTVMPELTGGTTSYPHPIVVGSNIILLCREYLGASSKMTGVIYKNSLSAWGTKITFGDFSTDSRYYIGNTILKDGKIHFVVTRADFYDNFRRDIFYLVYDPATDNISNIDGSHVVPSSSFPISKADHETYFRLYTHDASGATDAEKYSGNIPSFCFNSDGNPHVMFYNGLTTGNGVNGGGFAAIDILHTYWTGSAWSSPVRIGGCNQKYEDGHIAHVGGGVIQAMFPDTSESIVMRGGNIVLATRSAGGSWGTPVKVRSLDYPRGLDRCKPVMNGLSEFKWLFGECAPSQDYDGVYISSDTKAGYQRVYGWGQSGFVKNASAHASGLVTTLDELTAIGTSLGTLTKRNPLDVLSIASDPDGKFNLSGATVTTKAFFNYDVKQAHKLIIGSTLAGRTTYTEFNVAITDALNPASISGLALWIDPSDSSTVTSSGGKASIVSDKTGNGNNAVQADTNKQPAYGSRTIGGRNCLDFDAVDDTIDVTLASIASLTNGASTVFCVAKRDAGSIFRSLVGVSSGAAQRFGFYQDSSIGGGHLGFIHAANFSQPKVGTLDTNTRVLCGFRSGTTVGFYLNNGETVSNSSGVNFTLATLNIGQGANSDGAVGEILIYNRLLTTSEINQVGAYLAAKWGISWVNK